MAVDGAARRRRERRLRGHWQHECLSVRMAVAAATHHSSGKRDVATADVGVQTEHPLVIKYGAPAPGVTNAAPLPYSSSWMRLLSLARHQLQ